MSRVRRNYFDLPPPDLTHEKNTLGSGNKFFFTHGSIVPFLLSKSSILWITSMSPQYLNLSVKGRSEIKK